VISGRAQQQRKREAGRGERLRRDVDARERARLRRDDAGKRGQPPRHVDSAGGTHARRIVDRHRARAAHDRLREDERVAGAIGVADRVEHHVMRRHVHRRAIAFDDERIGAHGAAIEQGRRHDVAAVRRDEQQHVDRRRVAERRRNRDDRLGERKLAMAPRFVGVAECAIQQREREVRVRVTRRGDERALVGRDGRVGLAVFGERVPEIDVGQRFVRMFDRRLRVERARDVARSGNVEQCPEIGERAEMRRVAREHVEIRAFGFDVPREIVQRTRAREAKPDRVRFGGDQRVDALDHIGTGERLRGHAHRHRAPRHEAHVSTRRGRRPLRRLADVDEGEERLAIAGKERHHVGDHGRRAARRQPVRTIAAAILRDRGRAADLIGRRTVEKRRFDRTVELQLDHDRLVVVRPMDDVAVAPQRERIPEIRDQGRGSGGKRLGGGTVEHALSVRERPGARTGHAASGRDRELENGRIHGGRDRLRGRAGRELAQALRDGLADAFRASLGLLERDRHPVAVLEGDRGVGFVLLKRGDDVAGGAHPVGGIPRKFFGADLAAQTSVDLFVDRVDPLIEIHFLCSPSVFAPRANSTIG
jgi:hypothetical protein